MKPRLGIAFSGGGFRAAFFHLGVLRRLAELDLLRHVTTFSTVSGGSMLAALYFLHFKKRFEENEGELSREDFVAIVDDVDRDFIHGNRADLRNQLFMSTGRHFLALLARKSYGEEMARLYAQHIYGTVTRSLAEPSTDEGLRLRDAIVEVPSQDEPIAGRKRDSQSRRARFLSSGYPGRRRKGQLLREINDEKKRANIPRMIFNATCLNTGGRFSFMLNEVGGPMTGYVRIDEVLMLMQYKRLMYKLGAACFSDEQFAGEARRIESWGEELEKKYEDLPDTAFHAKPNEGFPATAADHLRFYLAAQGRRTLRTRTTQKTWLPPAFQTWKSPVKPIQRLISSDAWPLVEVLLTCNLGKLRRAKIAAWYFLDTPKAKTKERGKYSEDFWTALTAIDPELPSRMIDDRSVPAEAAALILDLYYMRSAEVIDRDAASAFENLTIPVAVAASANFPPIFTPFKIDDLFDRETTDTLALTDGGVHDNQGIDGLVEDGCDYIIATDAGGLLVHDPDPADSRLPMMDRIIEILMGSLREVQIDNVSSRRQLRRLLQKKLSDDVNEWQELGHAHRLREFVPFHVTSRVDPKRTTLPALYESDIVAGVRTDLDAFNDVEIAVLKYEGYRTSDAFVRPALIDDETSPFFDATPAPAVAPTDLPSSPRARRVLSAGARRFGRFSDAHPYLAALLAVIFAAALLTWGLDTCQNIRELLKNDNLARGLSKTLDTVFGPSAYAASDAAAVTQLAAVRSIPIVETLRELQDGARAANDFIGRQSIVGWMCALWALFVLCRAAYRHSHISWPDWPILQHLYGFRVTLVALAAGLARPITLVSLFFAIVFAVSLNAKWLLGVIPLWSVPLALLFALCHHVFRRLWLLAGWMPRRAAVRKVVLAVFG